MNKQEIILSLMNKIYDYNNNCISLSPEDKKYLETYYKEHYTEFDNVNSFMESNDKIKSIVCKLKSGKDEIDKQLITKKALQPGIISECICAQGLAKILGLQSYLDTERHLSDLPIALIEKIKPKNKTLNASRYIYYKANNLNENCIVQYGNPETGDGSIWFYSQEIIIEIKQLPAVINEIDLLYNDEGKIIIPENDEYKDICIDFNNHHTIFEYAGKNYKIFNDSVDINRNYYLNNYFIHSNIDLLIALNINKNKFDLIALRPSDFDLKINDNDYIIDVSNSEIRTTGKNFLTKIFTNEYFNSILNNCEISIDENNKYKTRINNNKISLIKGRGKNTITRIKFGYFFFVKIEDITQDENYYYFDKNKIKQSKSNMSIHININYKKDVIKKKIFI